jgi:phosphatidylglycerol:prolipoprotein diacylglycerol transferase
MIHLFPDPAVIIQIGPVAIRWYALAYIAGLVIGWQAMRRLCALPPPVAGPLAVDDFLTWATLGVVLGGRFGYVLFYQPSRFLAEPWQIVAVWQGGMSFHGGMLGVVVATLWFCLRQGIHPLGFGDRIAIVAPVGLGFGRIANFVNGELWGRPAPDWLPWAMRFQDTGGGDVLRHPSQLYEATLEGLVLLGVMALAGRHEHLRARYGFLTGLFLAGYAVARIIGEFFREPDAFLGFLSFGTTMGQLLSLPMLAAGIVLMLRARPRGTA